MENTLHTSEGPHREYTALEELYRALGDDSVSEFWMKRSFRLEAALKERYEEQRRVEALLAETRNELFATVRLMSEMGNRLRELDEAIGADGADGAISE